jgi:hypothetical protein
MAHRMTPARRAALRKAQLASARKRRKGTVRSAAKKVIGNRVQSAGASRQLRKAHVATYKARRGPSAVKRAKFFVQGRGAAKIARFQGARMRRKKARR